ncbi:MAG: hypothetical protein WEC75_09435 [Dehalococcoidia bacterium]
MIRRLAGITVGVALLLAVGAGASACSSGGDQLTLEEYFQELDEADNTAEERFGEADEELGSAADLETFQAAFPLFLEVLDDFLSDLDGLEPPDEAQEAHDEAVAAGQGFRDELAQLIEDAEDATTIEEFFGGAGEGFEAADARFTQACVGLEEIATSNSITVDLDCDDEGE